MGLGMSEHIFAVSVAGCSEESDLEHQDADDVPGNGRCRDDEQEVANLRVGGGELELVSGGGRSCTRGHLRGCAVVGPNKPTCWPCLTLALRSNFSR